MFRRKSFSRCTELWCRGLCEIRKKKGMCARDQSLLKANDLLLFTSWESEVVLLFFRNRVFGWYQRNAFVSFVRRDPLVCLFKWVKEVFQLKSREANGSLRSSIFCLAIFHLSLLKFLKGQWLGIIWEKDWNSGDSRWKIRIVFAILIFKVFLLESGAFKGIFFK